MNYQIIRNPISQPAHPCACKTCSLEFLPTSCLLKNKLKEVNNANVGAKPNKGINGELRVLTEKIRQSTKADSEKMKQKKLASIQAKLRAGKKLTSEEMDYLRAADPEAYMHALRIQQTRKSMEEALKHAKSKQEAQDII